MVSRVFRFLALIQRPEVDVEVNRGRIQIYIRSISSRRRLDSSDRVQQILFVEKYDYHYQMERKRKQKGTEGVVDGTEEIGDDPFNNPTPISVDIKSYTDERRRWKWYGAEGRAKISMMFVGPVIVRERSEVVDNKSYTDERRR